MLIGHLLKLTQLNNLIMKKLSKIDKRVWDFYISNITSIKKKTFTNKFIKQEKNVGCKVLKTNLNFNINKNIIRELRNNKLEIDATLDLHGRTALEAKTELSNFIKNCYKNNLKNIVIITGKGKNNKGIIKTNTPSWLKEEIISRFIVGFETMPDKKGGQGALFIKLKNKNKYNNDYEKKSS